MATATVPERPPFRRLHFFRGLVTYYTDWVERERYLGDKRQWHARYCHAPGVVAGEGDELLVVARGDLSVEVQPGCAIDGAGRELILAETQVKRVPIERLTLPCTVYVCARLREEPIDFVAYKQTSAQGHRRVLEGCEVSVAALVPDPEREVELGRILVERGARAIGNAANPEAPGANEVDLRFVAWAGQAGGLFDPLTRRALAALLHDSRQALKALATVGKIGAARAALHQVVVMATLHAAQLLDTRATIAGFAVLAELQRACVAELRPRAPSQQLSEWERQLVALERTLVERLPSRKKLVALLGTEELLCGLAAAMAKSLDATSDRRPASPC